MGVMIEPRKEEEKDPDAGLGTRVSVLEVKLDGLSTKVDEGFKQVDKRFEQIDRRFEQIDRRFEQIDKHFHALHRTLVTAMLAVPATYAILSRLLS